MAFDFPNSPTNGQQVNGPGGVVFTWDGTKWVTGTGGGNVAFAPLNNPAFVGDPRAPTAPMGDADTSIATTAFVTPAYANVGRNLLHNGLFNVQQRGAGPFSGSSIYSADRWWIAIISDTSSVSFQPAADAGRAAIGDEAFKYYCQLVFTGNSAAGATTQFAQAIEDLRRVSGKTLTVSFWASASANGIKLGANFWLVYGTGGSPTPGGASQATGQAVTLSTTWTRYSLTFTIPSSAGKTFGTNNDSACQLYFGCSSGANNNAFYGNIGVQSGQIYLWGIQCEIGAVATPLEKLDPQVDLANCQRFYTTEQGRYFSFYVPGGGIGGITDVYFPVRMRAGPTITFTVSGPVNVQTSQTYGVGVDGFALTASGSAAGMVSGQWINLTASADL